MGIVNVTPDSFSGDGLAYDPQRAVAQGLAMVEAGADLLDVGGESTRPGALPVAPQEEAARIVPVIRELASRVAVPVSADTSKPEVMAQALDAGAALINDVTALGGPSGREAAGMLAARKTPLVLMHMQNTPVTMQRAPTYQDVVGEVYGFLADRIDFCRRAGMDGDRLLVDTGIGFGKSTAHNLTLLRRQRAFHGLGTPLLLGVSRKRVVGALTGESEPRPRDQASHLLATLTGATMVRVHDVAGARRAMAVASGLGQADLEAA
ncbi:MAG: dihydropteroate synthase [Magnetococcales bacterium]|nr:dihydropteroate synthase [Magnetococcales bacterium]